VMLLAGVILTQVLSLSAEPPALQPSREAVVHLAAKVVRKTALVRAHVPMQMEKRQRPVAQADRVRVRAADLRVLIRRVAQAKAESRDLPRQISRSLKRSADSSNASSALEPGISQTASLVLR